MVGPDIFGRLGRTGISIFIDGIFRETASFRPSEICQGMVNKYIYIYVYVCMYVCIYVVYFKCFYIQGDGRDRKLLPVVAAGMSEILIENLTTRANILEKL